MMVPLVALAAIFAVCAHAGPVPTPLVLLDLSPEEAQKYLQQPPFTSPVIAAKTATWPLVKYNDPRFRSGESGPLNGHYWRNGYEIEDTENYIEDEYLASQYHGQDGLGGAAFGYSAPESSRVEQIQSNGDVQGSYSYADANDNLIQVKYWADSEGFHQEDNIPKYVPEPVQETPEVREARLAHEKAWQEAAALAKANPDPEGEYDPSKYETFEASEHQPTYEQPRPNPKPEGKQARQYQHEEEEPTGPPRGFFYSFQYPVSIIVPKNQAGHHGNQGGGYGGGQVINEDTIAVNAPSNQQYSRVTGGVHRPVEVHDAQVPNYRRH